MEKLKHKVDHPFWFRLTNQLSGPELDGREVPHSCSDPECPGDINRRKLQAAEEMARAIQLEHSAVCAFCGGYYPDAHTEQWPKPKCSCRMAGCRLPIVLTSWENAGKEKGE